MTATGSATTRLMIVRGNSGSGKSSIAREIRLRYGRGVAIVGQDQLRRQILQDHDRPNAANIGLIDLTARHALDHGFHVVLEGILDSRRYGAMLTRLYADHQGITGCFYLDVPFEETLHRHAFKANASEFGEREMRAWFCPHDLIPALHEAVIPATSTLDQSVHTIINAVSLIEAQ